ncbi:UDP-N-acetylmuramoyl-tripeptide--D-alanyl-D-alanine ligase [Pedobacter westerhofensis]|uniref:UDP-N-acetylmuramoyl-tripeptide--D-alanyl-D-alanine ligase n=1 Tax=Pedobacter westerhofensis TaxID=425512 RepID=A0A521DUD7_9SPHI|nr:UDP-N-acetylmuramoyl-tripeptide--D-alanyl-D-alanine ligase [Pedobacter westerhofensis]SMO75324.1 UDP-N-acetylmuramoyl-tripeptide--D-alanyl-D-alanine ligase [Pedobacter westerhofensis]
MSQTDLIYQHYLSYPTISTDTRNIAPGCLFFALKGENFDANVFARNALNLGAAYVIIDNPAFQLDDRCILVDDVLTTLQELAKYHRSQLRIPVIGLTGSNGKTTTKELINAVLAEKYRSFATKGNLNNHIGVPLSILAIKPDTEIAVIEMGANHQKEIEFLCTIAQPTHGLITNIGRAHLDGFGGFEGVKKGKGELFTYLKKDKGTAFINQDNPLLTEMGRTAELDHFVYYGTEGENFITGQLVKSDPLIALNWKGRDEYFSVHTNLTGAYNFENILAAICIGAFFNLTVEQINKGLSGYMPNNNRSQLTKTESNTLICDFYNANPSSMTAALQNISSLTAANKVAIIGDMFELGPEAPEQHEEIARLALESGLNTVIFIGKNFNAVKDQHTGEFFNTPAAALEWLEANPIKDSLVLLKGSRGMALEQLLPVL